MRIALSTAAFAATVLLASAALAGCGGGGAGGTSSAPSQDAGLFMTSLIREKATGEYELAWKSLNPLHQRVAPRNLYLKCENQTPFPGRLLNVSVVRIADDPVLIAGQHATTPAEAVTIRVKVASPGLPRPVVVTDTYHAIAVADHWTWILTRQNYASYRRGECPGAPTPKE